MRFVFVEWLDSHRGGGWQHLSEMKDSCRPLVIISVGWLLEDKNEHILIVPHISGVNDNELYHRDGQGGMTIPKASIIKITNIKLPKSVSGKYKV